MIFSLQSLFCTNFLLIHPQKHILADLNSLLNVLTATKGHFIWENSQRKLDRDGL